MRGSQRRVAAAVPRNPANDLAPTGFTIQPTQLVFGCTIFVLTVILMHFFVKVTGK